MKTIVLFLIIAMALMMYVEADRNYIHPPAFPNQHQYLLMFRAWMLQFGKVYLPREFIKRFKIWKDNVDMIYDFNNNYNKGFFLSVNQFADLTHEEFVELYLTKVIDIHSDEVRPTELPSRSIRPAHSDERVDWRDHTGVITPVGNQGSGCGCSYAWVGADSVQAERVITFSKTQIVLSKQQINDCSDDHGNNGCAGGSPHNTWEYVAVHNGLCTEAAYGYEGKDYECDTSCTRLSNTDITNHTHVNQTEFALRLAVWENPVAAGIDADNTDFIFYGGDVYDGDCTETNNHFVLVVGFDGNNTHSWWIIKNSWATTWGISGYMHLTRTDSQVSSGKCGIALAASYPNMYTA